jgi:Glutathione S-transferase, N-terminal domain
MSSEGLKLYEASGSPNSRRVRILLAEKGISVTRVPVDLGAKEQFSEVPTPGSTRVASSQRSSLPTERRSVKCPQSSAISKTPIPTTRYSVTRPRTARW